MTMQKSASLPHMIRAPIFLDPNYDPGYDWVMLVPCLECLWMEKKTFEIFYT